MTDPLIPVDTDDDVLRLVRDVLEADGTADGGERTTWLLLLDADDRPPPQAIPIGGMPPDPDPEDVERFAGAAGAIAAACGAERVVVVWQRPGGDAVRMQEADWAAALSATRLPIRAQVLATEDGVRLLDPAFEGIVAI